QTRLISNIATDLLSHNTTFFIGAGFSRDLGYPSWGGLLKEIIKKYDLMENIKTSSLFNFLSEDVDPANKKVNEKIVENLIGVDFLRLAGYVDLLLKEEKGKDIKLEINNIIQTFEDDRKYKKEEFDNYRAVFSFISDYITELITTNYDTNLEYCIDKHIVIHRNLSSVNNSPRTVSKDHIKIYKIHGCIKDNDNNGIIITEKDYQEFSSSNKYIFHKIYSTFMENNIVFIGYSLDDPNIRGLLSEVIEEIKKNSEATKKIYWINRGTVNEIDKRFYENMYSVQIIDQIEILDFFNTLKELTTAKWNDVKLIEEQWMESTMELIAPSGISVIQFNNIIAQTINAKKYPEVLNQIYQAFITNSSIRNLACNAFFSILPKIPFEQVEEYERKIIDILETEDAHLLHIVELIQKDFEIRDLFISKGYDKILLESLISRARTNTAFYQYEYNAKGLLEYYGAFKGSLGKLEEPFIDAFYYNYSYLTNGRKIGYAFESLRTVQRDLKNLNEDTVVKILRQYPTMRKSDVQIEQMEALIATIPVPERQNKLKYDFIYKIPFVENLRHTVAFRLMNILSNNKEFEPHFKYTIFDDVELNGSYDSVTNNGNITVNESEERFIITYKGEELVINITPDLKTGEAHLVINGTTFNKIEPLEIREHIIPIIDDTFKDWGLLSEETVQ
ncbi:SIR2 family protein, partial [Bacillus paramycoides]|uniref:SIR2 family protein n=1 Tax=Bacillus paramycoides TaxID=2026194 RepID=UPI002E1B75B4|nr:SIR2 family protein [Bacillus paramycoides]